MLRSVHRYASDAMVVTMLMHMLRHFAFDRLRGFRWFSWVTGVALIWLVYVAGINGYMLPWDQLAQFVITASFEWLDWLPSFGGALMRNFIYPASVSDRFFSLLVVHAHRRAAGGAAADVGARAARAQGQHAAAAADRASACWRRCSCCRCCCRCSARAARPTSACRRRTLQLDWFYLPLLPLIDAWPLGAVWALVGGAHRAAAGAAVAAAGGAAARGRGLLHLTVHPGALPVPVRSGETLLEAGLRAGLRAALRLPHRRLRPVPVHGAQRPRRPRRLPAGAR